MSYFRLPVGFASFLYLAVLLLFISFQDSGKIRYFEPQTLIEEADTVLEFPSMTDGIPDELYQIKSKNGHPVAYYKKIYTGVCFDNECRMLDIILYWNITGRYLGFELPEGEFLSKFDHEPFEEGEYKRLHALLADLLSPLGVYSYNELAPQPAAEIEEVDGVSSATSKDLLQYVVEGAAFTTYTLRTIVYGSTQKEVQLLTEKEISEELVLKILNSPDVNDQIWALDQVAGLTEFTPELRTVILNYIDDTNYSLAERAIHSLPAGALESGTLQMLLLEKFYQNGYGLKTLILDKLKEAPNLDDGVRKDLARNIHKWEGALLTHVLELYSIQKVDDIETCRTVSELLQHENRYISQKAFGFLKNTDQKYDEIDHEVEMYRANRDSIHF